MRTPLLLPGGLLFAAAAACRSAPSSWRPTPVPNAPQPAQVVAGSAASDWAPIAPDDLLLIDLADGGHVIVQLAPAFAPVHVANVRALVRGGGWSRATVYRVQDNYVAQWGNGDATATVAGVVEQPPAEFERPLAGLAVHPLGTPDAYAPMTGYVDGWAVAYDPRAGTAWLPHCYGSVAAARGNAPSTGSGSELYAVIGQAPRHLDRALAGVGRVIEGMGALSARPRGSGGLGFYDPARGETPAPITRARLASDLPEAERPRFEAMRTDTPAFAAYVTGRANRSDTSFVFRPAGGVDVCNAPVPVRRKA